MLNDIEYIRTNPDQFVGQDQFNFNDAESKLTEALNSLVSNASQCADNVNACAFVPISLPEIRLPKRIGLAEMSAAFSSKGAAIARDDALASLLLTKQTDEANKQGFLIGLGIADGQIWPGPEKDKFGKQLPPEQLSAFQFGVTFSVDRNSHLEFYSKGAAVIKSEPATSKARDDLPTAAWLGFTIGCGLFGPVSAGGAGHTAEGSGSMQICNELSAAGQQGFKVAVSHELHR